MASTSSMNFQAYLEDTYRIIKEEPIILVLGGFAVQLLTLLSMGILSGPLMGGYFLVIIYYLRDNRKPSFNDIFSGLQEFGRLFPFFLVLFLILIGFMLLILPGFLFATWWLYVLPLMVDRKMTFSEAMRLSMNKVNETGFLMHFVFLLLITVVPMLLLNFLSAIIPFLFVLKILLPPFQAGCLASLYIDQFGGKQPVSTDPAADKPAPSKPEESEPAPVDQEFPAHLPETTADADKNEKQTEAETPETDSAQQPQTSTEEDKETRKENP